MVELETLEQLAEVLRQLRPGEAAEMTDDVFEQFFPPGIKDDGAKGRALTFAWENGCVIDRRAEKTAVYFMRPTRRPSDQSGQRWRRHGTTGYHDHRGE